MLTGSLVAIVTPMFADGELDFPRLKSLIDWHVDEGTNGIVVVGTTGESPTVDFDEHERIIKATVEYANERIPVIAGTGANSTKEAIRLARFAQTAGADYSLSVVPYYNKPSQEGLYQHFKAIAEACDLPMILYNVPGRTVADLSNDTAVRLSEIPTIVGIKDATGNMGRGAELLARVPKHFGVYSGDDISTLALLGLGAHGCISVTANVAPRQMSALCKAAMAGRLEEAVEINDALLPLHSHLFVEANPIPVKWALAEMGKIEHGLRLPLTPLDKKYHALLRASLEAAGVLDSHKEVV